MCHTRAVDRLPPTYGKLSDLRKRIKSRLDAGGILLSRLSAAEDTLLTLPPWSTGPIPSPEEFQRADEVKRQRSAVRRSYFTWDATNRRLLREYFGPSGSSLYGTAPIPPSHWDTEDYANRLRSSIEVCRNELTTLVEKLPSQENRAAQLDETVGLTFTRSARLIDDVIVDDFERRLRGLHDRRNVRRVLGASKEMMEAISRAALEALQTPSQDGDDLGVLTKRMRTALTNRSHSAEKQTAMLEASAQRLTGGLATLVQALAEMRNSHGEGHGRHRAPKGLQVRHGRLAADVAIAYTRYIVATLRDLGLA